MVSEAPAVVANKEHLSIAYGAMGLMLVVPQFVLIHPYLHLLLIAPLLVWTGAQRALIESQKAPEDSQMETVSKKDAMQFPLIGSAVLFGLYIVVKFVNKEYLDILISVYFAFLGSLGIFGVLRPPINSAFGGDKLHLFEWSLNYQVWRKTEDREPFSLSFNWLDVGLYAASSAAALAYAFTKKWWLNNLLGMAFSVQGIEMLALGSYMIGVLLLCGLFVYDVFWVFGTEVMVAVAKGLNAPVKILFPKALGVKPMPFSMLGLGDIVIPGIFVALMLRFDSRQQLAGTPYFLSNLLAYELGLVATVGVMHFFDAAQPALLYLVPACIGASLLCAAVRGETPLLLKYSEEKKEEAPAESKKEQ